MSNAVVLHQHIERRHSIHGTSAEERLKSLKDRLSNCKVISTKKATWNGAFVTDEQELPLPHAPEEKELAVTRRVSSQSTVEHSATSQVLNSGPEDDEVSRSSHESAVIKLHSKSSESATKERKLKKKNRSRDSSNEKDWEEFSMKNLSEHSRSLEKFSTLQMFCSRDEVDALEENILSPQRAEDMHVVSDVKAGGRVGTPTLSNALEDIELNQKNAGIKPYHPSQQKVLSPEPDALLSYYKNEHIMGPQSSFVPVRPSGRHAIDPNRMEVGKTYFGAKILTEEMMRHFPEASITPPQQQKLLQNVEMDRKLLLGWQILLRDDMGVPLGVVVVTDVKKEGWLKRKTMFRVSTRTSPDCWIRLAVPQTKSGTVNFTPLRRVYEFE